MGAAAAPVPLCGQTRRGEEDDDAAFITPPPAQSLPLREREREGRSKSRKE